VLYIIKNTNSFANASSKQYQLANNIRNRILDDLEKNIDMSKVNDVANSNFNKEELLYFFKEKDDFKYFLEQNNINTNSVLVSAILKLKRERKV